MQRSVARRPRSGNSSAVTRLLFKLVNSDLQLLVKHTPVGDHDDRIEYLGVGSVMQARQPMREPCNAIRFARAGRMLN